jgi:hypothetical protein
MSIEAMKLALEALEKNYVLINGTERFLGLDQIKDTYYAGCFDVDGINKQTNDAITTLRTAIEQAEKQEPVAWVCYGVGEKHDLDYQQEDVDALPIGTMLYAAAQREWVGLTDEEVERLAAQVWFGGASAGHERFAKLIEAKLKEKNEAT